MKSLNTLIEEINSYATSLELEGAYADVISKLIAYGIYTKNAELFPFLTEISPQNSTLLNSKIYHAGVMNYSVFRGHLPKVTFKEMVSTKIATYERGDLSTSTNGYYLYYAKKTEITSASLGIPTDLTFYVAGKNILTYNYTADELEKEDKNYIDILTKNLSEDIIISTTIDNKKSYLTWTNNIYDFFKDDTYNFFIMTLPGYSIRLIKRYKASWQNNLEVKVLSYNETQPSNYNIIVPGFTYTKLSTEITNAQIRDDNKNSIVDSAMNNYAFNSYLATTTDLIRAVDDYMFDLYNVRGKYIVKYKVGYVILFYYLDGVTEDENVIKSDIKKAYDAYSKSVEVLEDIVVVKMKDTKDEYDITVEVPGLATITQTQLNTLAASYVSYCNSTLANSTMIGDILDLGTTSCRLKMNDIIFTDDITFTQSYDLTDIPYLTTVTIVGPKYPIIKLTLKSSDS